MHHGVGKLANFIHVMQDQAYSRGINISVWPFVPFPSGVIACSGNQSMDAFPCLGHKTPDRRNYNFHCRTMAQKGKVHGSYVEGWHASSGTANLQVQSNLPWPITATAWNGFPEWPATKLQFDLWQIYSWTYDKITHWPMTKMRLNHVLSMSLTYNKTTGECLCICHR